MPDFLPFILSAIMLMVYKMTAMSILELPPEIQGTHLWPCLHSGERRMICQVSRLCNELHSRLYPMENSKRSAFKSLSMAISKHPLIESVTGSTNFTEHLIETKIQKLLRQSESDEDIKLMEKIICQMATSQNHDLRSASTLCNQLLVDIPMSISNNPSILLMRKMLDDLARNRCFQLSSLGEIFKLASEEMKKTSVKYNRYTRFAINHLELIPEYPRDGNLQTLLHAQLTLRSVWNNLYSIEFIDDYLGITPLRECGLIVRKPLRMIIDAALEHNGSWNLQYLTLIANHPKLFFDIEYLIVQAARHWETNQWNMIYLIDFFVDCGLVEWKTMVSILTRQFDRTGNELYRTLRIQAYNKMLLKLARSAVISTSSRCCSSS